MEQGAAAVQEPVTQERALPRERIFMWSTFDTKRHIRWYFRPVGPGLRFWELFNVFRRRRDYQCASDTVSGNDADMTYLAKELRSLGFEFVDRPQDM